MVRIWNYNKSRIHATRGIRHISMKFDEENLIFFGEVKKASAADMTDLDRLSDYILFAEHAFILDEIEKNDWIADSNSTNQNFFVNNFHSGSSSMEKRPRILSENYTSSTDYHQNNNLQQPKITTKVRQSSTEMEGQQGHVPHNETDRPLTSSKDTDGNMAFIGNSIKKLIQYNPPNKPNHKRDLSITNTNKTNLSLMNTDDFMTPKAPNSGQSRAIIFPGPVIPNFQSPGLSKGESGRGNDTEFD
jgi:hypothetical protein